MFAAVIATIACSVATVLSILAISDEIKLSKDGKYKCFSVSIYAH